MKNLQTLTSTEFSTFFNSFDLVLCDVHGVLYNFLDLIPGSPTAVKTLQKYKNFVIVSNNTFVTPAVYSQQLQKKGFDVDTDHIVTPIETTIFYLQKHRIKGPIYALASEAFCKALENEGFNVQKGPFERLGSFKGLIEASEVGMERVDAVLVDTDVNLNYLSLEKAHRFLQHPETVFLKGGVDFAFPVGNGRKMIAIGCFQRILEDMLGREGVGMGKPAGFLLEHLKVKFGIEDPGRVLFIGDSVQSDMAFATAGGYQKLLVLSGLTNENDVKNWEYPVEFKPEYVVDSLENFNELIVKNRTE